MLRPGRGFSGRLKTKRGAPRKRRGALLDADLNDRPVTPSQCVRWGSRREGEEGPAAPCVRLMLSVVTPYRSFVANWGIFLKICCNALMKR